jgi:hypothetical protein
MVAGSALSEHNTSKTRRAPASVIARWAALGTRAGCWDVGTASLEGRRAESVLVIAEVFPETEEPIQ